MKAAAVFRRADRVFVNAYARTTAGVWRASQPFLILEGVINGSSVGEHVLKALAGSRDNVEHPTDWKPIGRPLLELAGLKSWNVFMKGAVSCDVQEEEGGIRVVPSRNKAKFFEPDEDQAVRFRWDGSTEQIGKVVLQALERFENDAEGS